MVRSFANIVFLAVSLLVSLTSSHAQLLVNDYSGAVTGYGFTESFNEYYATSSPTANPTTTGNAGQVDIGFYTVNYSDEPFFKPADIASLTHTPETWEVGVEPADSTLEVLTLIWRVTGFLVSLRKEALNTASTINFYILTNQDMEVSIPISTSGLSSTSFTDVAIDLNGFSGYTFAPGLQASQIGIKGSAVEGRPTIFQSIV